MFSINRSLRGLSGGIVVSLLFFCAAQPSAAQAPFSRIVVFGGSLSDTGNGFAFVRTNVTPPDYSLGPLLIPGGVYARGGHHLSNGATWIEYLARPLGLAGTVRPAFQSANQNATNFAVGAARAREDGLNFNLQAQVNAFLEQSGGMAPSDALYVIEIGGNDVRDALLAFPAGSDAILEAALESIVNAIITLHGAGARHVLVWNVPDISLTPAVRILGAGNPLIPVIASLLTQSFNASLALALNGLSALPQLNIVPFDANGLITAIVADPGAFGLTDAENACVAPNDPPFACQNPGEFLFWDGIHPTTAAHAIVASAVASVLGL
jgi:outer membrane lipase/esterase